MRQSVLLILLITFGGFLLPKALSSVAGGSKEPNSNKAVLEEEVQLLREKVRLQEKLLKLEGTPSTGKAKTSSEILKPVRWEPDGSHLDDPFIGESEQVIVMAFLDYNCEPCRKFIKETFPSLSSSAKKAGFKLILRDFPLKGNRASKELAQSAHCAGEQSGYWEMMLALSRLKSEEMNRPKFLELAELQALDKNRFETCLKSKRYRGEIERDLAEGKALGAKGAPSFFIGKFGEGAAYHGYFLRGAQPYNIFEMLLDKVNGL